jgi:DNA-binding NarL/FixJ family response regulator
VVGNASVPLHHPKLNDLSPLVAGDRVPTIADRLHISQHTVRNHLKSMYRKLDVGAQADLIALVRSLASAAAQQPAA